MSDHHKLAHLLLDFLPVNVEEVKALIDKMGGPDSPLVCGVFSYCYLPDCLKGPSYPSGSRWSSCDKFLSELGVL